MERMHHVGEKLKDKERAIVVQFSFYKDQINIIRNCKTLKGTKISIFEDFSPETVQIHKEKWKEVLVANRKQSKISYLHIEVLFAWKGKYQHNRLSDFLS